MIKKIILYSWLLSISHSYCASGIFIIVHGTWGTDSAWCKPGGDFHDELEKTAQKLQSNVITFMWPGHLNHNVRLLAAQGLANIIKSYPRDTEVIILAHSHGGNVGMLASQLLSQDISNKNSIKALYMFGTPICDTYKPSMDVIKHIYNFFSFTDLVQPIGGLFKRTLPEHPNVANIRLIINNKEPGHVEFCNVLTARWLPIISRLTHDNIGNFQYFSCKLPGLIFLYDTQDPLYFVDSQQEALLERDRFIMQQLCINILRKRVK